MNQMHRTRRKSGALVITVWSPIMCEVETSTCITCMRCLYVELCSEKYGIHISKETKSTYANLGDMTTLNP